MQGDRNPGASMSLVRRYLDEAASAVTRLQRDDNPHVLAAARLLARSWSGGGRLLVAKTNHTLHEELVERAAGPVAVALLDDGGARYDECIREIPGARPEDVILIHSNCGTTAKTVSIAFAARNMGIPTIALTQLPFETSEMVRAEHPSGQRLHEVCDVVVDLGGVPGDGALSIPGSQVRVAPLSGVVGVAAAWAIIAGACDLLAREGAVLRVLDSVQMPGAAERNRAVIGRWQKDGQAVDRLPNLPHT